MAEKHPYVTAPSYLYQIVNHFRKSFPSTVTADTLKKLGFPPNNGGPVISILRSLGLIDPEGNKTEAASKIFSLHDDEAFANAIGKLVMQTYDDLFELHGENSWGLDANSLITFFRGSDETSDRVGMLQARTFQALSTLSGHNKLQESKQTNSKVGSKSKSKSKKLVSNTPKLQSTDENLKNQEGASDKNNNNNIGLTVRIEINLPSDGDQDTYNRIFKSIRENLLDV